MGVREAWGGGAWAALGSRSSPQPVKACYTISPDSLPGPGEPPTLPVGKAGIWGMGRQGGGGRLKPVPLKGTSTLYTCPHRPPTPPPRIPLRRTATGESEGGRDGGEGENTGRGGSALTCTFSLCTCSPHSLLYSHSNTGSWGLREEARGRGHWGFSVTRALGGRRDGGWEEGGGTLSQSLPLQALSRASCSPYPEGSWPPDLFPPALP